MAPKYKYKKMDKFGKKFLIWQGICSCGLKTQPFVTDRSMDSSLYERECIRKRLLPLIRQHTSSVLFWPDLATCHYSRKLLDCYVKEGIHFLPKELNPPNCPEVRPIERYWAIIKQKLFKDGQLIQTLRGMSRIWNRYSEEVTEENVRVLMGSITAKVRNMVRDGVY